MVNIDNIKTIELSDISDITYHIDYFLDNIILLNKTKEYSFSIIGDSEITNYIITNILFKYHDSSVGFIDFNASEKLNYIITINENLIVDVMPIAYEYNAEELENSEDIFIQMELTDQRLTDYCISLDKNVYLYGYKNTDIV